MIKSQFKKIFRGVERLKRVGFLLLALLIFCLGGSAVLADEHHGGQVKFNVKWAVEPSIVFFVGTEAAPADFQFFINGKSDFGTGKKHVKLDAFVFEERIPGIHGAAPFPYGVEEVDNEGINSSDDVDIFAMVASNDWWKLEFEKPHLTSNNDHYTTVPVYAKRSFKDITAANWNQTGYFTGNDYIQKDMGVYLIQWDLLVKFHNYHTRYGQYKNTFKLICTQF